VREQGANFQISLCSAQVPELFQKGDINNKGVLGQAATPHFQNQVRPSSKDESRPGSLIRQKRKGFV
jgi:hypothetical protein